MVALNLTDVGPDGESEPIGEAILDIAVAAARVVSSAEELTAARVSLSAMRGAVAGQLEHFPDYLGSVERLLSVVSTLLEVGDG